MQARKEPNATVDNPNSIVGTTGDDCDFRFLLSAVAARVHPCSGYTRMLLALWG